MFQIEIEVGDVPSTYVNKNRKRNDESKCDVKIKETYT